MAHHGDKPFDGMNDSVRRALSQFAGETGEFQRGKLTKDDQGGIGMVVTELNGVVRIEFGKPVAWVGMTPKQAVEMAQLLLNFARRASSDVLTIEL